MKKVALAIIATLMSATAFANEADDMAAMQQKLNAEVMEKPFSVEEIGQIDAYVQDAMKKDLKPREKPPTNWRAGYTCANLHNYTDHRDCAYYHRYYGRYW